MTFDALETSLESGEPVEIYKFVIGSETFLFTSAQDDVVITLPPLNGTYEAVTIQRSRIKQEANEQKSNGIQITVPTTNPVAVKYLLLAPDDLAQISLHQFHRDDLAVETIQLFTGSIQSVNYIENGRVAKMQALPLTKVHNRTIPRHTYQGPCNHYLYDERCKLLEADFEVFFTVTAVSGSTITVPGAGAHTVGAAPAGDVFEMGFVEFLGSKRMVTKQVGDVLTLLLPFPTTPLSQSVRCLPGCKLRYVIDCDDKFANRINFGGHPFSPLKNLFESGID